MRVSAARGTQWEGQGRAPPLHLPGSGSLVLAEDVFSRTEFVLMLLMLQRRWSRRRPGLCRFCGEARGQFYCVPMSSCFRFRLLWNVFLLITVLSNCTE